MNKKYVAPKMEITEFETEDVITTSDKDHEKGEGEGGSED